MSEEGRYSFESLCRICKRIDVSAVVFYALLHLASIRLS